MSRMGNHVLHLSETYNMVQCPRCAGLGPSSECPMCEGRGQVRQCCPACGEEMSKWEAMRAMVCTDCMEE